MFQTSDPSGLSRGGSVESPKLQKSQTSKTAQLKKITKLYYNLESLPVMNVQYETTVDYDNRTTFQLGSDERAL